MLTFLLLLVSTVLTPSSPGPQARVDAPPDSTFYAVSYVETMATSTKTAIAALDKYRGASRASDGFVRIEFFEQIGRPGHFTVVETWRDQKAFDARDAAIQKQLLDALQPIRVSGYDQRPYKTLAAAPAAASAGRETVYVIAHVDVTPNTQVPAIPILVRLAEASRQEAGNLRFDVVQHTMRANHFTVIEAWRNQQALDARQGSTQSSIAMSCSR
jgi:quinol monooxygenase YgiN